MILSNVSYIKFLYGDIGEILLNILSENALNLKNILFVSLNFIEEIKIKDSYVIPFTCLNSILELDTILTEDINTIVFFGLKEKLDEQSSLLIDQLASNGYRVYIM